jgi:polyisoprenoid-binding protein YceI
MARLIRAFPAHMKYATTLFVPLFFSAQLLAQQALPVDPSASMVMWTGTKITGEHTGNVKLAQGTITMNGTDLGAADITVDMGSITVTDLEDPDSNAKLLNHLESPDFFDTQHHVLATFRTTKVEKLTNAGAGKPNYRITGDLTIKGITHPVTFDCLVRQDGKAVRAAANLVFDRTKYDIRYRSGSFFPEIGDKAISDEVSLTFDIKAE